MGTSADIARRNPDGSLTVTHVSGDGYPAGVGEFLFKEFNTPEAQEKLWLDHNACCERWSKKDGFEFLDREEYEPYNPCPEDITYLWEDGRWLFRNWWSEEADESEETPEFEPLTKEAIIQSAEDYFGEEGAEEAKQYLES